MIFNIMMVLAFALPMLLGLCCYFNKITNRKLKNVLILISTLIVLGINIALCFVDADLKIINLSKELIVGLKRDNLSSIFSTIISLVYVIVTIYSFEYMKEQENEDKFYCFFYLSLASLMGMCYSRNLVTAYLFFELVTVFSFPLVLHEKTKESSKAALKYLFYSIGGAFLALIGLFYLIHYTNGADFVFGGVLDFNNVTISRKLFLVLIFLSILGFSAKAGMFPLNSWLPSAHPVAPSNASAVLSGIITKAGVFLIIRIIYYVVGPSYLLNTWVQYTLVVLAMITIVLGSGMAWACNNFKKRLAYSSISQLSYILLGVFIMNTEALAGSILHVYAHMCIKVCLFLVAGVFLFKTHKRNVDEFVGYGKMMPITLVCYSLVSLGLVGVPPTGGFYSKWFISLGALDSNLNWIKYAAIACLLISAILTAAYLLPIMIKGFFVKDMVIEKDEPSKLMTLPLIMLVVLLFLVGIFSGYIYNFVINSL